MKKSMVVIIVFLSFICCYSTASSMTADSKYIDSSGKNIGVVTIKYNKSPDTKAKAVVEKDGVTYIYEIKNASTDIPLQMKDGVYTVSVYENTRENKYTILESETLTVANLSDADVYKNSIYTVNYKDYAEALNDINSLLSGKESDAEKVNLIYKHIISNYRYDKEKAASVQVNYVPDLNEIVSKKAGICYDYASLFAAALRSNDIPAKLVMGYCKDVERYHAWNEVLLLDEWIIVDTCIDAIYYESMGHAPVMKKNRENFQATKVY